MSKFQNNQCTSYFAFSYSMMCISGLCVFSHRQYVWLIFIFSIGKDTNFTIHRGYDSRLLHVFLHRLWGLISAVCQFSASVQVQSAPRRERCWHSLPQITLCSSGVNQMSSLRDYDVTGSKPAIISDSVLHIGFYPTRRYTPASSRWISYPII